MSELLKTACEQARQGNTSVKQQVRDIGNKFLNSVEISAQEAVYIALQLPMRRSSREVVFINTSPSDERINLLKPLEQIQELEDDSEEIQTGGLIERYKKRPVNLENIALADWAAWYDKSSTLKLKPKTKTVDADRLPIETGDEDNEDDNCIPVCIDKSRQTKKHLKSRMIRSVWFNKEIHPEKHYRELLMLFTSCRNESVDIDCHKPYQERCQIFTEQINVQLQQYAPSSDQLDQALHDLNNTDIEDNMWDLVAPDNEHTEMIDREEESNQAATEVPLDTTEQYDLADDLGIPSSIRVEDSNMFNEMPDDEYRQTVRSLNKEQLKFFYHVLHLVKTSTEPFYCFLSGGAGVGKSHVTKALYQAVIKVLNTKAGEDFNQTKAILLAPTGKAAFNIHGNTIHSALQVPASQSLKLYKRLDAGRLNSLRSRLQGLKVIFLDEISMVGKSMFDIQVNKRLQDIKGCNKDFGGVSIIAIGDVFESLQTDYGALATNLWQKHFKMNELQKIMRQRESREFAQILNRLREGKHTKEDIDKLKCRQIVNHDTNYPNHAPHLFIQNNKVNDYNLKVYGLPAGQKYSIKATDSVIGAHSKQVKEALLKKIPDDPRKTMELATALHLAIGERIEVTQNIRWDDGMTNGAGNVIKFVQLYNAPKLMEWYGCNLTIHMLDKNQEMIADTCMLQALHIPGHQ